MKMISSSEIALNKRPTRLASEITNQKMKELIVSEEDESIEKLLIEEDNGDAPNVGHETTQIKLTGVHLNEIKMMKETFKL